MKADSLKALTGSIRQRGRITSTKVALIAILLISFILSNYANIAGSNWVVHPDDHEAYVLGMHLKNTGSLAIDDPMNSLFEFPVFTPDGAVFSRGKVVPTRALGIYFLTAAGLFLGNQGPFYILPLFGILALLFLFKIAELVMDGKKALLTTFLVALYAPFIYWNNMLFSNIPGLTFLVMGMYFLLRIAYGKDMRLRSYLLSALSFGLAFWMRYEALLIIFLLIPIVIGRRGFFQAKRLAMGLFVLLIILAPVGLLNSRLYGSVLGVGYTVDRSVQTKSEGSSGAGESGGTIQNASSLYQRFLKGLLNPDLRKIYSRFDLYLVRQFPMVLLAGLLGLLCALLDRRHNRSFAVAMLFVGVFWTYYTLQGTLWGGAGDPIASSYVRYMLIVFVILAIAAPVFLYRMRPAVGTGVYRAILMMFIMSFLVMQVTMLIGGSLGLMKTTDIKADYKSINDFFAAAPQNAVAVSSLYSKSITSRPVFNVGNIESADGLPVVLRYIRELLDRGYDVYLIEASNHVSSFQGLSDYISEKGSGLQVQTVSVLPMRTANDKVEKVIPVE